MAKTIPAPDAIPAKPVTAETMATRQKEIAVSEFFAKNRHLLGFDNPRKALLTTIKEAVDNSLDACEEAGILPIVWVKIDALNGTAAPPKKAKRDEAVDAEPAAISPSLANATRFRITVRDNGPGIVKAQIPNVFGRLLYGSKFHRLRMSRGQQGIGISAAGMYGLLTTGQPVVVTSKTGKRKPAHRFTLAMDTLKNRADILTDDELAEWTPVGADAVYDGSGTEVTITLEAKFQRGRASVDEYLEGTAIANPHATIHYTAPDGQHRLFPGEVRQVPAQPKEIKPHPHGVELGILMRMLGTTEHKKLGEFLQGEFSRVSPKVADEIVGRVKGLTTHSWTSGISKEHIDQLHGSIQETKIQAPPTDCVVPIGPQQILKGLLKEIKAEFYTAETREPSVYSGRPFVIECGIAYGGDLPREETARVIRFANRVPLLYQPSACVITKSVQGTNWRNYGMSQPRNGLPEGPVVVFVHMASVWVPFTSESKEAIADFDELISKEIKLALQVCGRKLNTYVRRKQRIAREAGRRDVFTKYIGEVVMACERMNAGVDPAKLHADLLAIAKSRTATADLEFDADGNPIRPGPGGGKAESAGRIDEDNTVVIESAATPVEAAAEGGDDAEAAPLFESTGVKSAAA